MGKGRQKIMDKSTVLFARIEQSQYEALRWLAYRDKGSIAQVVRKALDVYIESRADELPKESANV
jgi:hypothetical protein